jgi:hypothetical protein
MSDNTSRIDNSTARIDGTMRIGTQGLNAAGEVFDIGKTIVLNGKTCAIQSRLNQISGEALVYKVSIEGKLYALKHYRFDRPLSDTAHKALSRIKVHPKNRIIRIYDFGKYNGTEVQTAEATATATATVTADTLNLHSTPSSSGEIIKVLKEGDTLTVIGNMESGWVLVNHGNNSGYVSAEMIRMGGITE